MGPALDLFAPGVVLVVNTLTVGLSSLSHGRPAICPVALVEQQPAPAGPSHGPRRQPNLTDNRPNQLSGHGRIGGW